MSTDGFVLKEKWEFEFWSNPALRELIETEFIDEKERESAWKTIAVLNAKYPGAWELLRGEFQHREIKET